MNMRNPSNPIRMRPKVIPTPRPILPPEDSPLEDEALDGAFVSPAAVPVLAPDAELAVMLEPVMVGDCEVTVDDEVEVVLKRGVDVTVV